MLRGEDVKLHDPCGAATSGPLHPRPWEDGRETVACRASLRRLKIPERSSARRRLLIARVYVWPKLVTADAGRGFDGENMLGRKCFAVRHPLPNSGLRNSKQASEGGLRADSLDRLLKRDN